MTRGSERSSGRPRPSTPEIHRLAVAAGFEGVVQAALREDVRGIEVLRVESGALVVRGRSLGRGLSALPYLAVVLQEVGRTEARNLDAAMPVVAEQLSAHPPPASLRQHTSFRLRTSDEGALVRVDTLRRSRLEQAIGRWSGLRPDPRGGGAEIWLVRRRNERHVTLAVRINEPTTHKPAKGELKPDLAAALVRTTTVRPSDVFLDPFAGSGATLRARAHWDHQLIVGADSDSDSAKTLAQQRRAGVFGHASTGLADATDPKSLARLLNGHQVSVVVTDPPWGVYDRDVDLGPLYGGAPRSIREVAAPKASVVLLTALGDLARQGFQRAGYHLVDCFPVLVNGKKSEVVVFEAP